MLNANEKWDVVTENQIVALARSGDFDARRRIVERYEGLLRKLSSKYTDDRFPYDDLYQEASIGLLNAIQAFNPLHGGKSSRFVGAAYVHAHGAILTYRRQNSSLVRTWSRKSPRRSDDQLRADYDDVDPSDTEARYLTKERDGLLASAALASVFSFRGNKNQPIAASIVSERWFADAPVKMEEIVERHGCARQWGYMIEGRMREFVRRQMEVEA
jgi:RNA polymerase sigma factor (sigma-70 family)